MLTAPGCSGSEDTVTVTVVGPAAAVAQAEQLMQAGKTKRVCPFSESGRTVE
jgi:hypothetical protein